MGSSRERLLEAMVRIVGENGYGATSVADVVAEADSSRATFYKHFADKHDCFLAAYDMLVERVFEEVTSGCDASRPWMERVTAGLSTIVELFAQDPELARTAVVEVAGAGADARRRNSEALARLSRFMDTDGEPAGGVELPASTSLMAAGAVAGLIFDELQAGRAAELRSLLPELVFALLVPYIGPRAAAEEMRRTVVPSSR
jgi:AcrR family transcriptional regulator